MLKIIEIDGFKYIGHPPYSMRHIPDYGNFRKNCTYINLHITDWDNDKKMFDFLEIHIRALKYVKDLINKQIIQNPNQKKFHIIIRQDDDNELLYGKESYSVSNKKPKNIAEYIKNNKDFYLKIEEHDSYYTNKIEVKGGEIKKGKVFITKKLK